MQYDKPAVARVRLVGAMEPNPSWCLDGWDCYPQKTS